MISVINLGNRKDLSAYTEAYEKLMSNVASYHIKNGERVILMSFCDAEGDLTACERIKNACAEGAEVLPYGGLDVLDTYSSAKKIYGARFHSVMLAIRYGIPCVPIIYSKKTANALQSYGVPYDGIELDRLSE